MTETEIRKLRETVLQLWEGSEYLLLVREDLFEYVQNLKKELAEKFFDGSAKPHSFETIKQNAWIAFLEGFDEKNFEMAGLDESKKAAVIALDSYLEMLKSVNLDSSEGKSLSPKIKWEGSIRQLIYLFQKLSKSGLIPKEKLPSIISNHFCKKDGTAIKRDNISKQIYQLDVDRDGRPKEEDAQAIDDILDTLPED